MPADKRYKTNSCGNRKSEVLVPNLSGNPADQELTPPLLGPIAGDKAIYQLLRG
jgi:hypothetical protein